jgi:predicted CXXCH cytochrome family protein
MAEACRAAAGALCVLALAAFPGVALDGGEACDECHERVSDQLMPGHPIDVPIAGRIAGRATGLPLARGRITCLTCHTGHGREGHAAADPDFFLRATVPDLCARCHLGPSGLWDQPHAQYADTVHGGPRLAGPAPSGEDGSRPEIDAFSQRCLACHGSLALAANFESTPPRIAVDHSHPIGDYSLARPTAFGRYRAAEEVTLPARLVNGRVSCASCHRVYSLSRSIVTGGNRRQLCLSCHDLGHPSLPESRQVLARR